MSSSEELKRIKHREHCARYREKNRDKLRQKNREYDDKNPDRNKKYRATPKGHLAYTIKRWKDAEIECNEEWDDVYEWYNETTNCDICDKAFKDSFDKCLDHDHTLDGYNIRGVICRSCNSKDEFKINEI